MPSTPTTPDMDRTPTQPRRPSTVPPTLSSPLRPTSPTPSNASGSTLSAALRSGSPRRLHTPHSPATPSTAVPAIAPVPESAERRKASKARDLLRRHYGMTVGPPAPSGKPSDPMDIDSPAFDAKAYYDQLITTSTLPVLLKRENELLTQIRELDSERQSLVYNHHHELIAASDTISAMKTRAESLDADLDKLKVAFSEISRLSAQVTFEIQSVRPTDPPDLSSSASAETNES
ncbi:Vps51/Vps67-domain-containing protein [Gautieria morchelliformis]|nr:Vps51/Vps67-domain-containing protein [Gautieria morchelliformis]